MGIAKVVRVGKCFVVKFGEDVSGTEAENMLYALYFKPHSRRTFIVMEYIEGKALASA